MQISIFLAALAGLANARDIKKPGYIAIPVQRSVQKDVQQLSVTPEPVHNAKIWYQVSFSLGNPPQQITAQLDTGSSDLWVYDQGEGISFDVDESTTSEFVADDFVINYADGSKISGAYYKDDINWSSVTVPLQFAVTNNKPTALRNTGIFGIGNKLKDKNHYDNYPYVLKNYGYIQSVSYSLYLDKANASFGTILFGALDTSRYVGKFSVVPMTSEREFTVEVSVAGFSFNGTLDSGTTYMTLPTHIIERIAEDLGCTRHGNYFRGPEVLPDDSVTFTIGETDIVIPKSELWGDLGHNDGYKYLKMLDSKTFGQVLLGDSFLGSAYVVYDLENYTIGIAQANWNPGAPDYKIIGSEGIVV